MEQKKIPTWILVLLVILLGTTAFFGYQYYLLTQDPGEVAQNEVRQLVSEVSRAMVLPSDETPTVATVSDPEALKNQPFFVNSVKEDKVLIYTNAQKAILYRPSIAKIIEVAPINLGPSTTPKPPVPAKVTPPADEEEEDTKKAN